MDYRDLYTVSVKSMVRSSLTVMAFTCRCHRCWCHICL